MRVADEQAGSRARAPPPSSPMSSSARPSAVGRTVVPSTDGSDRAVTGRPAVVSRPRRGVSRSYDRRVPTSPSTSDSVSAACARPVARASGHRSDRAHLVRRRGPHQRPTERAAAAIGAAQARKAGPSAHLLAADKMPTAGASWTGIDTARDDVEVLGPCHLAVAGRHRRAHRRPPDLDAPTPRCRAPSRSWRGSPTTSRPGAPTRSSTPGGATAPAVSTARSARCARSPSPRASARPTAWPRATGPPTSAIVRKGDYLSVVVLVASPADLPDDSAVARAAVKRIAATF